MNSTIFNVRISFQVIGKLGGNGLKFSKFEELKMLFLKGDVLERSVFQAMMFNVCFFRTFAVWNRL